MRLTEGEFFRPGGYRTPAWSARMVFLRLVQKYVPEVLDALDEQVRPCLRRAAEPAPKPDVEPLPEGASIVAHMRRSSPPVMRELVAALEAWSTQFHLDAEWVR